MRVNIWQNCKNHNDYITITYNTYALTFCQSAYQIDLRKLRFYHAKHITTSVGGTDGIVWHALIATSKRMVDTLMVEYGIFNFATDAVYLGAIWSKFALELLL